MTVAPASLLLLSFALCACGAGRPQREALPVEPVVVSVPEPEVSQGAVELLIAIDDVPLTSKGFELPSGWLVEELAALARTPVCGLTEEWRAEGMGTVRLRSFRAHASGVYGVAELGGLTRYRSGSRGLAGLAVKRDRVSLTRRVDEPAPSLEEVVTAFLARVPADVTAWLRLVQGLVDAKPTSVVYAIDVDDGWEIAITFPSQIADVAHTLNVARVGGRRFDRAVDRFAVKEGAYTVSVGSSGDELVLRVSTVVTANDEEGLDACFDRDDYFDDDDDDDDEFDDDDDDDAF